MQPRRSEHEVASTVVGFSPASDSPLVLLDYSKRSWNGAYSDTLAVHIVSHNLGSELYTAPRVRAYRKSLNIWTYCCSSMSIIERSFVQVYILLIRYVYIVVLLIGY